MKEKISKLGKLLFTIFYAIYFIVSPAVGVIAAEPQKGEIRNGNETASLGDVSVNKKVEPVAGQEGYYDITFTVKGKKYTETTTVPTYTVFVVDASDSMLDHSQTPWNNAKSAAIDASKKIVDASSQSQVALVTFGTDSNIQRGFSHGYLSDSDFNALSCWGTCDLLGGTNYDAGLMRALELLNSITDTNAIKNVVFISDGEPNLGLGNIPSAPNSFSYFYYTTSAITPYKFVDDKYSYLDSTNHNTSVWGHESGSWDTGTSYGNYNYTRNNTLGKIKGKLTGENENIYSVSYNITNTSHQANLRTIATNGNYYNTDSDGIGQILADVANKISTSYAGEDATLTDNMGADFDVQTSSGFDVVGDDALSVHIDKLDDETRTFTIRVKIDPYASTGWHKTNDGFTLSYTDENGNEQTLTPEHDPEVYWVAAKGKVTANYYLDGTTTKLADSVVQINDVSTNGVRNTYETSSKDIYGYTLKSVDGEETGYYTIEDQEVNYYYTKNDVTVIDDETSIEKTGDATETHKKVTDAFNYSINYETRTDDYVGEATVTITDTLPYEVDLSKSNNFGGGRYNQENKTITWTVTKNVSEPTTENPDANKITFNKDITVYYKNITDYNVVNNVKAQIANNTKEDSHSNIVDGTHVYVKYLDKSTGAALIPQNDLGEKLPGTSYTTTPETIYGYTVVNETPDNYQGNYSNDDITVVYEYNKNQGDVKNQNISKTAPAKLDSVNNYIEYTINYSATVDEFVGTATTILKDTPIYKIDTSKANDFGDGVYDEATNTITWTLTNENPLSSENKAVSYNRTIKVYYILDDEFDGTIVNNVNGKTQNSEVVETSASTTIDKGKVTTKFVEQGTTTEIAQRVEEEDYYGRTTDTNAIDIYGYTLVTDPSATKETFAKEEKTVVYKYYKNPGDVTEEEITKEGSDTPVGKDELFTYDLSYNATIDDFAGTVTTTVTDTLPYAIDESASDLAGGNYNSTNNTITWTFDTEINEDNQDIEFTKTIKVKYVGVDKNKVKNTLKGETTYDDNKTKKETSEETEVKEGTITVRWIEVDKDGNEVKTLKDDSTTTGLVGDTLDTKADDFYGYTLLNEESETTETYAEKPQTVEYKYIRNAGDVTGDITKTGPATSDSINDPVTYDVEYTGQVDDFVGTATTIIKDSPLYKIDVTKSSLDGGEYDEATNTITWTHNKEITKDDNELSYKHTITLYYLIDAENFDGNIKNTASSSTTTDTQTKPAEEQTNEVTTTVGKGNVITKFVEEGTTKEIAESVTDTGFYGDTVETKAIDVYGYTLVTSPDTTTETFAKEEKTVVYEYSKNPGVVTDEEISKEGSDTPVGKDELFTYDLSYNATIDDFAGTVTTTVTDTLPYAIDESASDLAGGNYDSAKNTITWTFDTEINEDNQDVIFNKTIKVKYVGVDKNKVKNTLKGETTYDDNKTKKETSEETEVKEGTITVRWIEVDKDGEEIAPLKDDSKTTGLVGDTRDTKAEKFFGYTLLSDIPEEITATYKEEPTYVVYRYTKNPGDVTNSEVTKIGDSEAVSKNKEFTYTLTYKKTIDNFVGETHTAIIDTLPGKIDVSKSDLAGGEYDEENNNIIWDFDTVLDENHHDINFTKTITVVFTDINSDTITNKMHGVTVYDDERTTGDSEYTTEVKKSTIIVKYIDEEGNEIAESYSSTDLVGNTGTFNAKTIEGYTLKTPASGSITTTYEEETKTIVFIYTKNLPPKEEGIVPPQTGLDGVKYYGIYSIKYLVLLILVAARLKFKRA